MGTKAFTGDISGGRLSFIKRSDMYGENKKIGTRKCDIRLCGIDRSHQLSAFPRAGHGSCRQNFIIALFVVLILNGFLALSFSELHSMMPKAEGGLGQYTLVGLGPVASMVSTLSAYVIVDILSGSVEIAMCGTVLNQIFLPQIPAPVISVIVLGVLSYVNYKGVDFLPESRILSYSFCWHLFCSWVS